MKINSFILILFVGVSCAAQKTQIDTLQQVTVSDWGRKSFMVADEFWASVKDQLIAQVGEEQFHKIKYFSQNKNQPLALLSWDGKARVAPEEYRKRLNSLALYQVATCSRLVNGNEVRSTFLLVPYQELYWDKNAEWSTVYFIVKSDVVHRKE